MSDLTYKQIFAKEIGLMFKHGLKEPMKRYAFRNERNSDTKEILNKLEEYFKVNSACYTTHSLYICIEAEDNDYQVDHCDFDLYLRHRGYELMCPSYVQEHASELDGAKKPATKLTVAQICEKLGYEVEIVKEG